MSSMVTSNLEKDNSLSFYSMKSFGYFCRLLVEEYEQINKMALLIIVWTTEWIKQITHRTNETKKFPFTWKN
jgi:hypothetical protein